MKATFKIQNLKCGGCAHTIINKLSHIAYIENITVNNESNTVSFTYLNDSSIKDSKKLLNEIGYPVVGDKNNIVTKAKSYVSCAIGKINN